MKDIGDRKKSDNSKSIFVLCGCFCVWLSCDENVCPWNARERRIDILSLSTSYNKSNTCSDVSYDNDNNNKNNNNGIYNNGNNNNDDTKNTTMMTTVTTTMTTWHTQQFATTNTAMIDIDDGKKGQQW